MTDHRFPVAETRKITVQAPGSHVIEAYLGPSQLDASADYRLFLTVEEAARLRDGLSVALDVQYYVDASKRARDELAARNGAGSDAAPEPAPETASGERSIDYTALADAVAERIDECLQGVRAASAMADAVSQRIGECEKAISRAFTAEAQRSTAPETLDGEKPTWTVVTVVTRAGRTDSRTETLRIDPGREITVGSNGAILNRPAPTAFTFDGGRFHLRQG